MALTDTNKNIFHTRLLVDTIQRLSMAKDISDITAIVRTVARKLTGADGATFVLRDDDRCYYADEDAISPLWKGSRFPMNKCVSGWVMHNKKSLVIGDIYTDERIPADVYRTTFVKSMAMVPIRTMDPIGAIGNYWASNYQTSAEELAMLQALADITAVSIENVEVINKLEYKVKERTHELADALEREKKIHEMKSAFVSMASHELRTPLGTILTSASLAGKYAGEEAEGPVQKHLNRIKTSTHHLTEMLDSFLSIGKLEDGKMQVENANFDLGMFLHDVASEFDGFRKPGQEIQIQIDNNEKREVKLDKKILRNILLNLISNAIKYSSDNVGISATVSENALSIDVKDKGIGIPEEQQEKLFSKFFRASNANAIQGTGLGLNIVKLYVDLLGGTIGFTSGQGLGTTFSLSFPNSI